MEMNEKKNSITAVMEASMAKIREMVDSNTIVGEPITTVDRAIELVPQVLDRVESFIDRKKAEKEEF